jgi:DNA-binding IclR family transcriptional regulator
MGLDSHDARHMDGEQKISGVGLLTKGFQILDSFGPGSPALSQAELARMNGLPRSTASRLVRYLCDCGYLMYNDRSGQYRLGPAAVDLGRRASTHFSLVEVAQPVLDALSNTTDETIILTKLDETRRKAVCVHQIESSCDGLRVFEKVGAEFHLHEGAAPRAILAALPEREREAILQQALSKRTNPTLITPETLRTAITETIAAGYAVSREETYKGVVGVAAAILWPDMRPVGSIAIAAPLLRYSEQEILEVGVTVSASAGEISRLLRNHAVHEATQ